MQHAGNTSATSPPRLVRDIDKRLGASVTVPLYLLFTLFPVSYFYDWRVASLLTQLKWVPLFALLLVLFLREESRGKILVSGTPFILVVFLIVVSAFSSMVSPYESSSFFELGVFGVVVVSALLLNSTVKRQQAVDHLFDIVVNIGRIIIAVSFLMAIAGISLGRGIGRFSGWSDNPNSLALIIAPALVILFARSLEKRPGWRVRYLPFLLAGLFVLVQTGSRGGFVWITVSFLVFFAVRLNTSSRIIVFVAVVLVGLLFGDFIEQQVLALATRDDYGASISAYNQLLSGRAEAWEIGVRSIAEHPVLGIGVGNEKRLLAENASFFVLHNGAHLHSSYISTIVEIGFLGASFMIALFILAVSRGFRRVRLARLPEKRRQPTAVLPLAILLGALAHGVGETWFLKPGNANSLLFWFLVIFSASSVRALANRPRASVHHAR